MANTQDTFNGNGSNLGPFSFNFPWLESTDIKVSVDGVLKTAGTHYNLQALNYSSKNGGQVLFTAGNAPGIGTGNIRVYRDTDDEELSATFYPGSAIRAQDLNDNFTQNLYVTQEISNYSLLKDGSEAMEGDLDMGNYRITNLAAPTTNDNAVNKLYVDSRLGSLDVPGFTRWSLTAVGGETTLSGAGTTGGTLAYSVNREQVYLNGAQLQRDADYTANNGTSIVLNVALLEDDVVEVICVNNLNTGTTAQAQDVYWNQSGGGITRTVESKLQDVVSVKDFGAVGNGQYDDTPAFVAAFSSAAGRTVVGKSGDNYRITSTLAISAANFDGFNCTITKDFAGVGIQVTGGAAYSYLRNFTLVSSTSNQPSDYDASAAEHGISVINTRVEIVNVTSSQHKGAGFYVTNTSPNLNKSKYIYINGNSNSLAGCYLDGNYPTADDMSVWEINGKFQNNYGYGFFTTDTCPIRQTTIWLYAENNLLGTSAPADYAVKINRGVSLDIWAYVENQKAGTFELMLGSNTSRCTVISSRRNADNDLGEGNAWIYGSEHYNPSTTRNNIPLTVQDPLARIDREGESVRLRLTGNSAGTGNFVYGYLVGEGSSTGNPSIGFRDYNNANVFRASDLNCHFLKSWYTGGTSSSTKPGVLVEPSGTSSTNWSTNGTGFGVNAPSGFTGNVIDLKLNADSLFLVDSTGVTYSKTSQGTLLPNVINYSAAIADNTYVTAFTVPADSAWDVWAAYIRNDLGVSIFTTFTVYRSGDGPLVATTPVEVDSGANYVRLQVSGNDVQVLRSANTGGGARSVAVRATRIN
jgi:hypothetical protein